MDTHLINITFLENRLGELDLKNWWVAEYIGVDRKTLSRWLTGKVKTIKNENLLSLADCLKCDPEALILKDENSVVASKEEQAIAADLIVQENLLATLTPLGQWPLLESIVKATMQPNLPLPVMGKLYNLLSICSWRQNRTAKAEGFANKALEIGNEIGHRGVVAQAKSNLAILESYKGNLKNSIPLYEAVIAERKFINEDRTIAAALSNLAQDYQTYGDYEKSRKTQMSAIELYMSLNLPLNLSIAYCALGLLETELGNYTEAQNAMKKSSDLAILSNYRRGISAVKVYLADCAAMTGDFLTAESLLAEGFAGFADLKMNEALNYEIKGRLLRLNYKFAEAEFALQEGLKYAEKFPHEIAALNVEFSRLWKARKETNKSLSCTKQAIEIYQNSGAIMRIERMSK